MYSNDWRLTRLHLVLPDSIFFKAKLVFTITQMVFWKVLHYILIMSTLTIHWGQSKITQGKFVLLHELISFFPSKSLHQLSSLFDFKNLIVPNPSVQKMYCAVKVNSFLVHKPTVLKNLRAQSRHSAVKHLSNEFDRQHQGMAEEKNLFGPGDLIRIRFLWDVEFWN